MVPQVACAKSVSWRRRVRRRDTANTSFLRLPLFAPIPGRPPFRRVPRFWDVHEYQDDDFLRSRDDEVAGRGAFAGVVVALVHTCNRQAAELDRLPFDAIAQIVQPNDTQRGTLDDLRSIVAATGSSGIVVHVTRSSDVLLRFSKSKSPARETGLSGESPPGWNSRGVGLSTVLQTVSLLRGLYWAATCA